MSSTLPPRIVVAFRPTEWDLLLERHATPGQARFFLESRGKDVDEILHRHGRQSAAIREVELAIPTSWRRLRTTRADFSTFIFRPEDIIVAVGQDGLIPNIAKYLDGHPVVGVNPDRSRHEGALVRFDPTQVREILGQVATAACTLETRTMVEARLDDGQRLVALNEIYIGHESHQSSRYILHVNGNSEQQSSSGIIVATGTGSTGWARSIATERSSTIALPAPDESHLAFFVREAWPSVFTGSELSEGVLTGIDDLRVVSEMDSGGVVFGDGIEADRLHINWGQTVQIGVAPETLELVVG
ncbi:inorganic polyphosphate/ATP-NAD kinase [bacterium BMS3Bbin02]|nr:inorganic polyphosphate/ATP-NAD kinase [bacterium BMS3Bbin02]